RLDDGDQRHLSNRHSRGKALRWSGYCCAVLGRGGGEAGLGSIPPLQPVATRTKCDSTLCSSNVLDLTHVSCLSARGGLRSREQACRRRGGDKNMVARVRTVAFQGIEAVPVDVQVMVAPGKVGMSIVGLPDKAVAESRERVQAALHASGLSMPAKRVTVNLAPADLPKEGSHYDLPIALGLMAALGAVPADMLASYVVLGELSLDGTITAVAGALPAAIGAHADGRGLICPHACGPEAAWAGETLDILAPRSLIAIANHFRGTQVLSRPEPGVRRIAQIGRASC